MATLAPLHNLARPATTFLVALPNGLSKAFISLIIIFLRSGYSN